MAERMKLRSIGLMAMLLLSSMLVFSQVPQAHAAIPVMNNFVKCGTANTDFITCSLVVASVGDAIYVTIQAYDNQQASFTDLFTVSLADGSSDSFASIVSSHGIIGGGADCDHSACFDAEVWAAKATASGTVSFTVTISHVLTSGNGITVVAYDYSGAEVVASATASILCAPLAGGCAAATTMQTSSSAVIGHDSVVIASLKPNGNLANLVPGAGYEMFICLAGCGSAGASEIGNSSSVSSPTAFPFTYVANPAVNQYALAGAVFGPAPLGRFTCSITNMDAGNYLVAGINKFYDFSCQVQSNGIGFTNYPINDIQIKFNDSLNVYVFEYNNSTGVASIDSGSSESLLGTPTIVQSYNTGVRSMNITFPVSLNQHALDSLKRGLQLYAQSGGNTTRGFEYVHKGYFNIINKGGQPTQANTGLCSVPPGADQFQAICAYGSNSHNWIAMNATYYNLLSYQTQFAIELRNLTGGLDLPAFWQNYANSGTGTNPSSNKGDWRLNFGFYHWDNSSSTCCWVKGINVVLQMLQGRVGKNNLWTQLDVLWYNGASLITNQTVIDFVPSSGANGPSSVQVWLNLWYSQNNASTSQGGEVGAFYTGMHNTGYLIWSSWSPFQGNQTQAQTLMPLTDHLGATMSAQQAQFTKVFMNMSRPGAPLAHAKQYNFEIETDQFQIQEFNIASAGMTGIATPIFAVAIVPTIQSSSIFSPIINAIKSIATFFSNALVALGNIVWAGLGARFPWFTGAISNFESLLISLAQLMVTLVINFISILKFLYAEAGLILVPIQIIGGAWKFIQGSYNTVFGGASLSAMIEIALIFFFTTWFFSTMESKSPAEGLMKMASTAWRVLDAILYWTWAVAKLLIDSVEGLIP